MHQVADVEIWTRIREEAARDAHREPMLASFLPRWSSTTHAWRTR